VKKIILTGDDFGLSLSVNEAIEQASRDGILSCASLMVGAEAATDAVDRARRLSLRVGLHLVLVDGLPVLPPETIPNLVDQRGRFSSSLFGAGINFFFWPKARQELESEIRAQFEAFRKTGLTLDHVNAHHHMHIHPAVLNLILRIGRDYGMRAMRLPREPLLPSWRASKNNLLRRAGTWLLLAPWVSLLKKKLKAAGVDSNDFVFGMNDSGHMNLDLLLAFITQLPQGVTEIYFHPEICNVDRTGEDPRRKREYEVLIHPGLHQAILASGIQLISFSDLNAP
jgi:hopanoid biosynthesis associated protein HpnK